MFQNGQATTPVSAPTAPQGPGFLGVAPAATQAIQTAPVQPGAQTQAPTTAPANTTVQSQTANSNTAQSADFKSNFKDFFANMWSARKPNAQQAAQPPINVTVQAPPAAPTLETQQNQVMQQLGLNPVTLTEEQKQKFASGDFSGIEGVLNQIQRQSFMAAVKATQALVAKGTQDALEKAQMSTRQYVQGSDARSAMQAALPFTADPMFAPVAESVLSRALGAGLDTASAVEAVRGWFASLNNASANSSQANNTMNPNLSQGYSGGPQQVEPIDWAQLLGIAQQ